MMHSFKVDIHTFNQLFREHYPALRAYAGFLAGDHSAEDIVQDLFLYTWENRETITIHTSIYQFPVRFKIQTGQWEKIQYLF